MAEKCDLGYSYLVYTGSGGTVYAKNGRTGKVDYSGSDAGSVIQSVVNICNNKGIIKLKDNTLYSLSTPINIVGSGLNYVDPTAQIALIGGGWSTIIQQTVSGENAITLSNGASVNLTDFKIKMLTTNSGCGIEGVDTGADTKISLVNSYINNIYVFGCDATHHLIKIKNPFLSDFGYIIMKSTSSPHGMLLDATDEATHIGNCVFNHINHYSSVSGGYALTLQSLVNNAWINLNDVYHIDTFNAGGGILCKVANGGYIYNNSFSGLDLESNESQIVHELDTGSLGTIQNNHYKGMMIVRTAKTAINCSYKNSAFYGNGGNIFDFDISLEDTGSTTVIFSDDTNANALKNEYKLRIQNVTKLTTDQFVIGTWGSPKVSWQGYGNFSAETNVPFMNPFSGMTTNVNDGDSIYHRCCLTPTFVSATGTIAGEIVTVSEVAQDHFHVDIKKRADGSAGTAQTIYWRVGWNSD